MKRGYNSEVAKQSFLPKVFAVFGLVTILYKYQLHNHRRRQERAAVVTKKLQKVQLGQRDKLILVVDIGSSSVRCNPYIIHDGTSNSNIEKLSPVRLSQFGIQIHHDLFDGSGRTDADTVFRLVVKVIDDTVRCLRGRVAAAGRGGAAGGGWAVAGLGFAVFGGTVVGLGAGGVGGGGGGAVTPLFTYAEQSAGVASAAKALRAKVEAAEGLGIDHLFQRTGCPIHPAYASSQLWHLRTEEPSQWARVTKWQTLGSYIIASLTGESVCPISYCEASWTGLFDIWESQWERNLQRLLQIPDYQLAELCDPQGTYFVGLSNIFEKKWPELAQVKIYPAIVDGAAATIGSYCHEQNRYAVTIGTSAAIRVILSNSSVLEQKGIPRGLWCYRVDSQRLILGGSLTDGGSLIQWMLRTFCQTEVERSRLLAAAEALARAQGPGRAAADDGGGGSGGGGGGGGGHGITLLPFLAGERAPGWNDEATGSIFGLKRTTKPAELVLAGMESICFRLKIIFDLMQQGLETTLKSKKSESQPIVVASGGALSQSTAWRQALADSLGMPVAVLEGDGEATSRGVAITLMEMLSMGSDGENELHFKSINRGSSLCFHDEEEHAASLVVYPQGFDYYLDSIQEQINLYEKLYGK